MEAAPCVRNLATGEHHEDYAASWRWGLWSPNDGHWHERVRELCHVAESAPELPLPAIPLKIHQIWLGDRDIPEECRHMMETWKAKHPDWEYYLWADSDAEIVLERSPLASAFARAKNPAERSDILRLEIILQHGGLYVDVDFECMRPFDGMHHKYSFYCGVSNVGAFELNNGLFAASPGHPVLQFLRNHVSSPWPAWGHKDVDPREAVAYQLEQSGMLAASLSCPDGAERAAFIATTGPGFFTRGVMRALVTEAMPSSLAPAVVCAPEVFYPLPNSRRELPYGDRTTSALPSSMAMHHWCRTWESCEGGLAEK